MQTIRTEHKGPIKRTTVSLSSQNKLHCRKTTNNLLLTFWDNSSNIFLTIYIVYLVNKEQEEKKNFKYSVGSVYSFVFLVYLSWNSMASLLPFLQFPLGLEVIKVFFLIIIANVMNMLEQVPLTSCA